ncbi:MAG: PEP/pyruvate-binding domain-containing protein, partial [Deltaproteobacteria bacterium]
SAFRAVQASEFSTAEEMREYIVSHIHGLRRWRQKGVVAQFNASSFDPDVSDFVKIGQGSLGGKARSLAFMAALLQEDPAIYEKYGNINIEIPKTLVISTDVFEAFVSRNNLQHFAVKDAPDKEIAVAFLKAEMPEWLVQELAVYLTHVTYPLSVRSSSALEDLQFQPYAGLYQTYMIPNNHPDRSVRIRQLIDAIKLVYASTYYEGPKAFARHTSGRPQEENMAIIVQKLTGEEYGDYYYPAISGVGQSHNFYPIPPMKREDGIASIALGLGKTVVEGERALRFCPKHPTCMPQFSTVDDTLSNAQRYFYALKIRSYPEGLTFDHYSNLERREVDEAEEEFPVQALASTYIPEEHRIRDSGYLRGPKVLTFAQVLKYNTFPLPSLVSDFLDLGRRAMGCPVEIEFSASLSPDLEQKSSFYFLQMRPMVTDLETFDVKITAEEVEKAFCFSTQALGNGMNEDISDIVYVKPEDFRPDSTVAIAKEIGRLNAELLKQKRPYLLVGPGRWGSADRWLGIPVQWHDISGVGAIIELRGSMHKTDPSQGTHFFQNITSLGIHYVTVTEGEEDRVEWEWLRSLPAVQETPFLRHVRLDRPFLLKIDGKTSQCVMIAS